MFNNNMMKYILIVVLCTAEKYAVYRSVLCGNTSFEME